MIKELRIGNFVNKVNRDHLIHFPESEILVIQEIGYDCVVYPLGSNPANLSRMPIVYCGDLSPISLAEEWLLKFGFVEHEHYTSFYKREVEINNHTYVIECDVSSKLFFITNIDIRIEYVHQLQNLYFALTGKELQITQPAQ